MAKLTKEQIYEEAKVRVKAKRNFWGNLIFYAVVTIICLFVWALSGGGYPWFLWVLGPWGVLVIFHYLRVFVLAGKSERSAIEKEWRGLEEKTNRKGQGIRVFQNFVSQIFDAITASVESIISARTPRFIHLFMRLTKTKLSHAASKMELSARLQCQRS